MSRNILIVDDELPNRRLLEALLVPEGYAVAHASNGKQALERIAAGGIDLVLLDVLMPGMNGIETCQRIRSELALSFLPVVMVTALADRDSRLRGKQAGADDFLTKPVFEDELLARVRNLLLRHDLFLSAQRERAKSEAEAARSKLVSRVATSAVTCRGYGELRSAIEATLADNLPIHSFVLFESEREGLRIATPPANASARSSLAPRVQRPCIQRLDAMSTQSLITFDRMADMEPFSTVLAASGATHGALVPLIVGGDVQGALLLTFTRQLSGAERILLEQLSPHLANAAANVRSHVKARELGEARERLAALLVHDFKNPLSIIKTNLYFLGEQGLGPEDAAETLGDCHRAADRLLGMIVDLMDVARAEEGSLSLNLEPVSVGELLEEVSRSFDNQADSLGITIACHASQKLFAEVDRGLLLRVLENIMGNATRYTRRGGSIDLSIRDSDEEIVLEVANDGTPIAANVREHLFEKYGTNRDISGSPNRGLGLYFCRLVIEAHGGAIAARNGEGGRGVTFEMRLPKCEPGSQTLPRPARESSPAPPARVAS